MMSQRICIQYNGCYDACCIQGRSLVFVPGGGAVPDPDKFSEPRSSDENLFGLVGVWGHAPQEKL